MLKGQNVEWDKMRNRHNVESKKCRMEIVSDREVGCCLEPEGNGVNLGGGNEGGPSPPSGEQDKQLTASRGGYNSLMEREEDGKKGHA